MRVIQVPNVRLALPEGMRLLKNEGIVQPSRNGDVLVVPFPVTTVYERPMERVLFSPGRNANPFFHLFEALWMLAGRNDASWLDRFVGDFSERYAENGILHGAYGYRWRRGFGFDQLDAVVEKLKKNPDDRQAVIQMWDARETEGFCEDTGDSIGNLGFNDLHAQVKDRPCNTHIYLRVHGKASRRALDITVCCRSNDIIWGAYGANAVHFSILHEYLAARLGVGMGRYYQVSNNFHAYCDVFDKMYDKVVGEVAVRDNVENTLIVTHPKVFDEELWGFFEHDTVVEPQFTYKALNYLNSFFTMVALPMYWAHYYWKRGDVIQARSRLELMSPHSDWKIAAREWMERADHRKKRKDGFVPQVGGTHYQAEYQHWDFIADTGLDYFQATATKYLTRWRRKGGVEDLKKALSYLDKRDPMIMVSSETIAAVDRCLPKFYASTGMPQDDARVFGLIAYNSIPDARKCLLKLIDDSTSVPKTVPLTEENHHAERAKK